MQKFLITIVGKYLCNMEEIFNTSTIAAVAEELLAQFPDTRVFAFEGPKAAGKTAFIHALCSVLGVKNPADDAASSIINTHITADGEKIYHLNLGSVIHEKDAINAGVKDCLDSGAYCFAEWTQRAPGIFPGDMLTIGLQPLDETNWRLFTFPG